MLIDTAGMSQRDVRLANQFTTLKVEGHAVRTVLALSAGADRGCLAEALKVFEAAKPEALIVTKLDEAAALGGVLSLAIGSALAASPICPTASACRRTCIAPRRSVSGCCTTR